MINWLIIINCTWFSVSIQIWWCLKRLVTNFTNKVSSSRVNSKMNWKVPFRGKLFRADMAHLENQTVSVLWIYGFSFVRHLHKQTCCYNIISVGMFSCHVSSHTPLLGVSQITIQAFKWFKIRMGYQVCVQLGHVSK